MPNSILQKVVVASLRCYVMCSICNLAHSNSIYLNNVVYFSHSGLGSQRNTPSLLVFLQLTRIFLLGETTMCPFQNSVIFNQALVILIPMKIPLVFTQILPLQKGMIRFYFWIILVHTIYWLNRWLIYADDWCWSRLPGFTGPCGFPFLVEFFLPHHRPELETLSGIQPGYHLPLVPTCWYYFCHF